LLREAAGAVLAGEFGEYVRSHRGRVEVLDVRGGIVSIRFHDACHGCPAAAITMQVRFERELRARCPILVSVRSR
jgi:Fe-S cluster biogenesis protein NfuA